MKTTLNIPDQLLADAKVLGVKQRTTLSRLVEEGLQWRLQWRLQCRLQWRLQGQAGAAAVAPRAQPRLPVFLGRGGLVAGANPLSNRALMWALGEGG